MFKSVAKIGALVFALGIVAYVSHRITLGPEAYCKTSSIAESWPADRAYKATVLMRDCNLNESISYSVRVDAFSPPPRLGWFAVLELESDTRPEPPKVKWSTARQLNIVSETRALGGRLSQQVGDDLTIIRTFLPVSPGDAANY
jgi:hypothetical protein